MTPDTRRDIPFYTALAAGCISIEADVWAVNNTLFVGHESSALSTSRTLASLYIQPILSVLQRENPTTPFVTFPTHNGVFDSSSGQTLYLFVDVKTSGPDTWPLVVSALEPLRSAGFLTSYNGSTITPGAVTVVGTGNTPLSVVSGTTPRDYFYDAPLDHLNDTDYANLTSLQSPIASADFSDVIIGGQPANGSKGFSQPQLDLLNAQIETARSRGIGARYYDTPAWPTATRNLVWKTLVDMGVALLNADSVDEAAGFSDDGGYW